MKESIPLHKIVKTKVLIETFSYKDVIYFNLIRKRTNELCNYQSITEVWTAEEIRLLKKGLKVV